MHNVIRHATEKRIPNVSKQTLYTTELLSLILWTTSVIFGKKLQGLLTLLAEYFSPFDHSTCSLSVLR